MGADELLKTAEIEAEVIDGTFADALLLSLGSNGENSVIPRTKDDARRSVYAILDNEEVLKTLLSKCKGHGGVHRVFADVCRCSTGTIDNALKSRGLKPKGDTLIAFKPKAPTAKKPEPRPDAALQVPTAQPVAAEVSEATQRKLDNEAFERIQGIEFDVCVKEADKCVRRIAYIFASFVTNPVIGGVVREEMDAAGFGLSAEFDKRMAKSPKDFSPHYEMLELWELVPNFSDMLAKVDKRAKAAKEAADKAAAKEAEKAATPAK